MSSENEYINEAKTTKGLSYTYITSSPQNLMLVEFECLLARKKMTTRNAKHGLGTAVPTPGETTCWAGDCPRQLAAYDMSVVCSPLCFLLAKSLPVCLQGVTEGDRRLPVVETTHLTSDGNVVTGPKAGVRQMHLTQQ